MSIAYNKMVLVKRPNGLPKEDDFKLVSDIINESDLPDMNVLIKVHYLSVDAGMRIKLSDADVGYSYEAYKLNEPIYGYGVGTIIASKNPNHKVGEIVASLFFPWAEYFFLPADIELRKINPTKPLSYYLNVLGLTGLTAYHGITDVGAVKENDVVLVSSAAGSVGYVVGQVAKIKGATVIGMVGSDDKVKFVTESLGFDTAINYKKSSNLQETLKQVLEELKPKTNKDKIDVYFDNVGGETLDNVLPLLGFKSRVPLCGVISQYNGEEAFGLKNISRVLYNRTKLEGFMVLDYADQFKNSLDQMEKWIDEGKLKNIENVAEGIENIAKAFISLLRGENICKQLVKIDKQYNCLFGLLFSKKLRF